MTNERLEELLVLATLDGDAAPYPQRVSMYAEELLELVEEVIASRRVAENPAAWMAQNGLGSPEAAES